MMTERAVIQDGVVTNIVVTGRGGAGGWQPPDGAILADVPDVDGNRPHIGWAYSNDRFEQPITGPLTLVDADLNDVVPPYVAADGTQYPRSIARDFSDADLAALGWYRLNLDDRPEGLVIVERGPREWRGDPPTAWQTWTVTPMPASREAVNFELERRLRLGAQVSIGERTFTVQTRDQDDLTNIQGRVTKAQVVKDRGETREFLFRDEANEMQALTPDEMIDLGDQVFDHREVLAFASYQVKAQIADGTLANAADIPAAFDAILSAA